MTATALPNELSVGRYDERFTWSPPVQRYVYVSGPDRFLTAPTTTVSTAASIPSSASTTAGTATAAGTACTGVPSAEIAAATARRCIACSAISPATV